MCDIFNLLLVRSVQRNQCRGYISIDIGMFHLCRDAGGKAGQSFLFDGVNRRRSVAGDSIGLQSDAFPVTIVGEICLFTLDDPIIRGNIERAIVVNINSRPRPLAEFVILYQYRSGTSL